MSFDKLEHVFRRIEKSQSRTIEALLKDKNPWKHWSRYSSKNNILSAQDTLKTILKASDIEIIVLGKEEFKDLYPNTEGLLGYDEMPMYEVDIDSKVICMTDDHDGLSLPERTDFLVRSVAEYFVKEQTKDLNKSDVFISYTTEITAEEIKMSNDMNYKSDLIMLTGLTKYSSIIHNEKEFNKAYEIARFATHTCQRNMENYKENTLSNLTSFKEHLEKENNKTLVKDLTILELKREREQLEKDINSLKAQKEKLTIENEVLSKQNKTLEKKLEKTINKSISSIKEYIKSQEFVNELNGSLQKEDYLDVEMKLDDIISCTEYLHKKELGLKKTIEIHAEKNNDFKKQREERLKQLQKEKEKDLEQIKKLEKLKIKDKVNEKELDDDDELEL